MIYITGDTHGGVDMLKLSDDRLKDFGITLTENDHLIITGDFGFPFTPDDIFEYEHPDSTASDYRFWIKWLAERPYKILFIDGNHDNHDWWSVQPVTQMFGGSVQIHPHAENVIHLMRGEVYEIEGESFFAFGGAASVDKAYRREGYSWWSGEEATDDEIKSALETLERVGFKVDNILTHTLPERVIAEVPSFRYKIKPCKTASFLDTVLEQTQYKRWFCGHFHLDTVIEQRKAFVLYNTVNELYTFDKILSGERTLYTVYNR